MAKSRERLLAREMRTKGESLGVIAEKLGVSKSSAGLWTRDIVLNQEQMENLLQRDLAGLERGRIKAQAWHRNERNLRVNTYGQIGSQRVDSISSRELFLIGLALYWAEGSKTGRRIIFVNSDPNMIRLFIRWAMECFGIKSIDFSCRIQINESHESRLNDIQKHWLIVTGVPETQFTKPTLIHAITKKHYDNPEQYFGVLAIKVRGSTNMSYLVDGGIARLREVAQSVIK